MSLSLTISGSSKDNAAIIKRLEGINQLIKKASNEYFLNNRYAFARVITYPDKDNTRVSRTVALCTVTDLLSPENYYEEYFQEYLLSVLADEMYQYLKANKTELKKSLAIQPSGVMFELTSFQDNMPTLNLTKVQNQFEVEEIYKMLRDIPDHFKAKLLHETVITKDFIDLLNDKASPYITFISDKFKIRISKKVIPFISSKTEEIKVQIRQCELDPDDIFLARFEINEGGFQAVTYFKFSNIE